MRLSDVIILTTSGWESTGSDFHFSFQDVKSESHLKIEKGKVRYEKNVPQEAYNHS